VTPNDLRTWRGYNTDTDRDTVLTEAFSRWPIHNLESALFPPVFAVRAKTAVSLAQAAAASNGAPARAHAGGV
jgi:hypothetical protein